MVVAVIAVGVMHVTADEVVDVVAVRNRVVSTGRTVLVAALVLIAVVAECARGRVAIADVYGVAFDGVTAVIMKLPFVQIIDMVAVPYRGVAAARSVLVVMLVWGHAGPPVRSRRRCPLSALVNEHKLLSRRVSPHKRSRVIRRGRGGSASDICPRFART